MVSSLNQFLSYGTSSQQLELSKDMLQLLAMNNCSLLTNPLEKNGSLTVSSPSLISSRCPELCELIHSKNHLTYLRSSSSSQLKLVESCLTALQGLLASEKQRRRLEELQSCMR